MLNIVPVENDANDLKKLYKTEHVLIRHELSFILFIPPSQLSSASSQHPF